MIADTTITVADPVPGAWLDSLAHERAFSYASAFRPESLWDRFVRWLLSLFGETIEKSAPVIDYVLWGVLSLLVVGIVFVWLKSGTRLLQHRNLSIRGDGTDVEDITGDDMDRIIGQEVAAQRWRSAIRYLYLRSLQDLQSAGSISWKKDKTNRDYLREVTSPTVQVVFTEAVRVFERTWYGDEAVDEALFNKARPVYDAVRQTVRTTA